MFKTNLQNLLNNALELFNKKNFFEAEKIYKQILEIDNKNAEAYCALGTISAIRKKYDEAISEQMTDNNANEDVRKDLIQNQIACLNELKKVKKENITPQNIGEIMLCQIPGISSVSAIAILKEFQTLPNLLNKLHENNDCLNEVSYVNSKNQTRKINKTVIQNIKKFLLC